MQDLWLKSIEEAIFRANPNYELVLFGHLPREQQHFFNELQKSPNFYGILRPCEQSGLGIKSVCQETALLFVTMQKPGRLPGYVKARFGDQCNQAIAELVLDGVLEIESDGMFVSRYEAYELIYRKEPMLAPRGTIARLSLEALKYAQMLETNDSAALSARLYFYNRLPASPHWKRMFPTSEAVAEHLGIQVGGSNHLMLERSWSRVSLPPPYDGWLVWKSRHAQPSTQKPKLTYKLYISPHCVFIREAFQATVEVLSDLQTAEFKVGKDVYGLLRPDKLVAYFWSFEELEEAAKHLTHKLQGIPAHSVPFTAEMTSDGLLSWAIDPPREEQALGWWAQESWRWWVTNRLATALLTAKTGGTKTIEPWRFSLERLRLEGVDTTLWTLKKRSWEEL